MRIKVWRLMDVHAANMHKCWFDPEGKDPVWKRFGFDSVLNW